MKRLVFIDNDNMNKALEAIDYVKNYLEYYANIPVNTLNKIEIIPDFAHLSRDEKMKLMYEDDNIILTWSMFTATHFNSLGQLANFLTNAGRYNIKGKTYIDSANNLLDALNRNAESISKDAHHYFRGIQNNNIICFDGKENKFKRCLVDFEFHNYKSIKTVDIDISELLK